MQEARSQLRTQSRPSDVEVPSSAALRRIIDEVRNMSSEWLNVTAYNRTYHRHNR
jgi:hypothetical protein